jgi:hypothetical protein
MVATLAVAPRWPDGKRIYPAARRCCATSPATHSSSTISTTTPSPRHPTWGRSDRIGWWRASAISAQPRRNRHAIARRPLRRVRSLQHPQQRRCVGIQPGNGRHRFIGFGPVSGAGHSDMVLRNITSGAFEVYDIANNQVTAAASLGAVGSDWQVVGIAANNSTPAGMGASDSSNSQLVQAMVGLWRRWRRRELDDGRAQSRRLTAAVSGDPAARLRRPHLRCARYAT